MNLKIMTQYYISYDLIIDTNKTILSDIRFML